MLTKEDRLTALGSLADAAKASNGSGTAYLLTKIRGYELRYEMSSDEMLEALQAGRQKETAEIARWLFYLDALSAHAR